MTIEIWQLRQAPHAFEIFHDIIRYSRSRPCPWQIEPDDWKSAFITIEDAIDSSIDLSKISTSTRK